MGRSFQCVSKMIIPISSSHSFVLRIVCGLMAWESPRKSNIYDSENVVFPTIRGIATSELLRAANLSS